MTIKKLFGTDGIRGNITAPPLWPENIAKLGRILGFMLKPKAAPVVIGRDTRASGEYIEQALVSGILSMGVDCQLLGVLPTSAVAFHTRNAQAAMGIMISASHNPYSDNGLKLFDSTGHKISLAWEQDIEDQYFAAGFINDIALMPGRIIYNSNTADEYVNFIKDNFAKISGLNIVIDCAHGAAANITRRIFELLQLNVHLIGIHPDGKNINQNSGSEAPEILKAEVINRQADLGIAFDGDADRVIFVDERGQIIDGDAVLAIMAIHLKQANVLKSDTIVATIMSSLALDKALAPHGIKVIRAHVGDKLVAQKMREENLSFGGENSGHLILFPKLSTGDGIFFALMFLTILKQSSKTASALMSFFRPTPKLLKNIEVSKKIPLTELPKTQSVISKWNTDLKDNGRVLLRYSGTENKARLLVEAQTQSDCHTIANEIARLFGDEIRAA